MTPARLTSRTVKYRDLGGLRVSVVGLGASRFGGDLDLARTRAIIDAALESGVNLIDTADVYGGEGVSERLIGESLRGRRDQAVLATKFGMNRALPDGGPEGAPGSRTCVRRAVEGSLRRLQTDHIDLYQYHVRDGVTPIEETLGALSELVDEGKVRYIGASNLTAGQLAEAARVAQANGNASFVSLQNGYSLLQRDIELEVVPECRRLGVGILPYWPLASGLLTGKYGRGEVPAWASPHARGGPGDEQTYDRLDALARFAQARGLEPAQAAIAGLAGQPMIASVIAGATSPAQVRTNAGAADWEPTAEDLAELDRIFPQETRTTPPPPARAPRRRFAFRRG
jgi:aryl-alcohol dehydrogenase-like predicted oxidoreductase